MRKIGSKRGWSCAIAIIFWASGFPLGLYAQQAAKLSPKVMAVFNVPLADLKEDDPPLLRLKKERFNAALNEAKARFDLYNRGLTRIPELIAVGERLFGAEVDLYDKPEEKAQVLQRQLDVYTEAQANLEKQVREGLATQADLERLRITSCRSRSTFLRLETSTENARLLIIPLLETVVAEIPRTAATELWLTGVPIWRERNRNASYRPATALTKTRRG